MKRFTFLFLLTFMVSCSFESEKIGLSDPDIQAIIDLQDKRDTKALIPYFLSDNSQVRARACLAMASIQDTAALSSLYTMLEEDEETAKAAAFAVGQIASTSSLPVLKKILAERSMNESTRYAFLIALGKCATLEDNYYLASQYNVGKDARGTAWALFYMARNKKINPAGLELCYTILQNEKDPQVRLGAAQTLVRSDLEKDWKIVKDQFMSENDEDVLMALAASMQGIDDASMDEMFIEKWSNSGHNVQINSFKSFNGESQIMMTEAKKLIRSKVNINLKITAATFIAGADPEIEKYIVELDLDAMNWRVRSILLGPAIAKGDMAAIQYSLQLYTHSSNLYEKGDLLSKLGQLGENKAWLIEEILNNDSIVSTYGMGAYDGVISKYDDEQKSKEKSQLLAFLESKNDAVITYSAFILRDSVFADSITLSGLHDRISRLEMPRQLEASIELEKTLAYLEGKEMPESNVAYNHPILVDSLAGLESIEAFSLETTKGKIIMQVEALKAPGTVMAIAQLIEEGYYDGKLFHRVVPNFVAQTGCPYGDGWGGQDFSIRSEFSDLEYGTGTVGMASAGKDTESCQWFITHSPTPHLNGRYSIFAYVTEGMEVVQQLEVGDRIISMNIDLKNDQ